MRSGAGLDGSGGFRGTGPGLGPGLGVGSGWQAISRAIADKRAANLGGLDCMVRGFAAFVVPLPAASAMAKNQQLKRHGAGAIGVAT